MIEHLNNTPAPPKRVVILGASGFVGHELSRELTAQEIDTLLLSSREVDLLQPDSVGQLAGMLRADDALVFASAITPDKGKDFGAMMRNLKMAEHVSAALGRAACSQVVYISSDAVYSDAANPVREDSSCESGSLYGLMHVVREKVLAETLRKSSTPLLILRPCAIFGPGDTHNSYGPNRFVRTALADRKITLFGNGEEKRDHLFSADFSRLIVLGLQGRCSGILNVAPGRSVSFGHLAEMVAELTGQDVRIERLPRATPITHRHFDPAPLIRAFPEFRFMPLPDGLLAATKLLSKHVFDRERRP